MTGGPSPGFLANVWAPFAAGEQLAGVGSPSAAPMMSGTPMPAVPPPPNPTGYPSLQTLPGPPPTAGPPPAPPPGMSLPTDNPGAMMSQAPPQMSQGPAPAPPTGVQGPPPPPPGLEVAPGGNAYPLVPTGGGGMTKAYELERRGPSLLAAQDVRNQASEDTIERVGDRNQAMAQQEYAVALDQERQARMREEAAQQTLLEREEEMQQRQADFDGTVRQLGRMGQIDRGRFWASRTTAQKVAGFAELFLSGFTGAQSMIMKRIDDDVKAQEFAYYATRDTAQAKQTAFAMAMQKYQNADAARAMARAAAIDVTQAQFAQVGAKWKGTEAANRADMALAALQDEKMMQIANGIQFVPSQYRGRTFMDPRTGLLYSEAEAKAMSAKVDERDFENRKQAADIGGKLMVEDAKGQIDLTKAQLAQGKEARAELVTLPGGTGPDGKYVPGETVQAPSAAEATTLRNLSASVLNAQQLVERAKQIRSDPSWLVSPTAGKELKQIQSELTLAFKDRGQLGALSGPDMDLAQKATADLTSISPGVDKLLDNFSSTTNKALRNRVQTIAGASAPAKGQMPGSFKGYGK